MNGNCSVVFILAIVVFKFIFYFCIASLFIYFNFLIVILIIVFIFFIMKKIISFLISSYFLIVIFQAFTITSSVLTPMHRFIVREYEYDEGATLQDRNEIIKLNSDKNKQEVIIANYFFKIIIIIVVFI